MKYTELVEDNKRKLEKAIARLEYSFEKVKKLPENAEAFDDESLETWESFSARFSRVTDLFLTRYLRSLVLENDPGFTGSLRDFINQGEKLGVIDDVEAWMSIRELRNITKYDCTDEDLENFFKQLKCECPRLLGIRLI